MKKDIKNEEQKNKVPEKQGVVELHIENEELYKIKGETLIAIMNSLNVLQSLIKVPCIQVEPIIVKIAQDIKTNK